MWACVSSDSGSRRGIPNKRSHLDSFTMRKPVAKSKYRMFNSSEPSLRTSTSCAVIRAT
jgi:hypothetical protein